MLNFVSHIYRPPIIYLFIQNFVFFRSSFMFDEPSSYLDVKQRLKAAQAIRNLIHPDKYIIVVEHDLSVLDYLSDFICCLYGVPGCYGVVTMPSAVRDGKTSMVYRFPLFPLSFHLVQSDVCFVTVKFSYPPLLYFEL